MNKLRKDFDEAMLNLFRAATDECDYTATYFLRMLDQIGGVQTAHQLLSDQTTQSGFARLWECGRLDLTVECLVLDRRFESLFDERERREARRRLQALGFEPSTCEELGGTPKGA